MANKRYDQFAAGTYSTSKIFLQADAATGALEKVFLPPRGIWGEITGTLSAQSDLNTALTGKEPTITAGTNLQYWRGDKVFATLNTAAVPELTNLYYTDARARSAISLTTTGTSGAATYNSSTGVLNIPNYATGGTVAGSNTEIQFNNSGAFGASSNLRFASPRLSLGPTYTQFATAPVFSINTNDNTGATPALEIPRPDGGTSLVITYDGVNNRANFRYQSLGSYTTVMTIGSAGFGVNTGFTISSGSLTLTAGDIKLVTAQKIFFRDLAQFYTGYNSTDEQIRISTLEDATNRYVTLGGQTSGGTWTPTLSMNAKLKAIGIGVLNAAASSKLEIVSTTQGFLPPRMTTTQKNAISSPAAGLVLFDSTLAKLCVFTTAWETITSV